MTYPTTGGSYTLDQKTGVLTQEVGPPLDPSSPVPEPVAPVAPIEAAPTPTPDPPAEPAIHAPGDTAPEQE
jgi:hypothetical protein